MKKREEKSQSEKSVQAEMTLLGAIEQIAMSAEDSALSEKFYKQNADTPILVTVFGIKVRLQPKSKVLLSVSMIALQSLRES